MMLSLFDCLTALAMLAALPADVGQPQNPITGITGKMTGVAINLTKEVTGPPVQARQAEIIQDLDELIAALEKECAACRNGIKRNRPTRGMADSQISAGTGGIADLIAPGDSQKDWAKLSDRERDRILQSMSEGFPPEYRTVLERYYRRLAEETSARSSDAPNPDSEADDAPEAGADDELALPEPPATETP